MWGKNHDFMRQPEAAAMLLPEASTRPSVCKFWTKFAENFSKMLNMCQGTDDYVFILEDFN